MSAVLEALEERAGASSTDRPAWLSQRHHGVTATDIAKLMRATPAGRRRLIEDKVAGKELNLSFKRAARWGTVREAYIADWLRRRFNVEANDRLFRGAGNDRHLATPDGIGLDFDERVTASEIKTGEDDLTPGPPEAIVDGVLRVDLVGDAFRRSSEFWKKGYYDQVQWQILVLGADRGRFTWEQHDGDWSGWPERGPAPVEAEPRTVTIPRDDFRIDELVTTADLFLSDLDAAFAAGAVVVDPLLEALLREDIAASAAAKAARAALEAYVAANAIESYRSEAGSVSYAAGKGRTAFDQTAFKAAHPALAQEFMRTYPPGKPTLRVTPAKNEGADGVNET